MLKLNWNESSINISHSGITPREQVNIYYHLSILLALDCIGSTFREMVE